MSAIQPRLRAGATAARSQPHTALKARVVGEPWPVALAFARLKAGAKHKGHSASDFDFLIAATAQAHGLVLATLNYRHFQWMEGLAVEDWTRT